jgi:hypothetical protein
MFGAETCSEGSFTNTRPRRDRGRIEFPAPSGQEPTGTHRMKTIAWGVGASFVPAASCRRTVRTLFGPPALVTERRLVTRCRSAVRYFSPLTGRVIGRRLVGRCNLAPLRVEVAALAESLSFACVA